MNLIGRFLTLVIASLFRPKVRDPFVTIRQRRRVWLHDMDLNVHLTAARYFSFGDLCRIQWLVDCGLGKDFLFGRYRAVLNAQELTYIREFPPLSRVDVVVRLVCWDDKYAYFEQRFYRGEVLHSIGHARMAILQKGQVIRTDQVFADQGKTVTSPPETEAIKDWKETLAAKRDQFTSD